MYACMDSLLSDKIAAWEDTADALVKWNLSQPSKYRYLHRIIMSLLESNTRGNS